MRTQTLLNYTIILLTLPSKLSRKLQITLVFRASSFFWYLISKQEKRLAKVYWMKYLLLLEARRRRWKGSKTINLTEIRQNFGSVQGVLKATTIQVGQPTNLYTISLVVDYCLPEIGINVSLNHYSLKIFIFSFNQKTSRKVSNAAKGSIASLQHKHSC